MKVRAAYASGKGRPNDALRYAQAGLLFGGWIGFVLETAFGATLMGLRWSKGTWRSAFPHKASEPPAAPALNAVAAG